MTSGKPAAWESFETEIANYVRRKLMFFGLDPKTTTVFSKKGYYSKTRSADIVFDVSLETRPKGAPNPLIIWLWECKSYTDRKVDVSELEEFHHKLQQVGAHKGTVVTRYGFGKGAIEVARTHGIGLAVLEKRVMTMMHYSEGAGTVEEVALLMSFGVSSSGQEYRPGDALYHLGQVEARSMGLVPPLPPLRGTPPHDPLVPPEAL